MKKPTTTQKFHLSRLGLFLVLAIAVLMVRGGTPGNALQLTYNTQAILGYATNMSINDLLVSANQSRAANGLAPLTLNAKLNSSAQMKANDMIANNYWSHVSPSGVQPWYWFQQAGYSYKAAGENLAYGFNTGYEVNTAWMNSTTHKANILGSYIDVGFGIASGPQYQGSANTVVVAHYGTPLATTPAPTPSPAPTPTPSPTVQKTTPAAPKPPAPAPAPTAQQALPSAPAPGTPTPPTPAPTTPTPTSTPDSPKPATTPATQAVQNVASSNKEQSISVFDEFRYGKAPLAALVAVILVGVAGVGFVLTHRVFMKHLIQNGRKFIVHHPLLDVSAIILTVALILTSTVGHLI